MGSSNSRILNLKNVN